MVCRVADNFALEALRIDIGAPKGCHSQRVDCIHRLPRAGGGYYGIAGAFLGYCQALFERRGTPTENTIRVAQLLAEAGLPWARSHELFLGHRRDQSTSEFVEAAADPLRDLGRVPILITGLDAARDGQAIREILDSPLNVVAGETVLCRITADGEDGLVAAQHLMEACVAQAHNNNTTPSWWPLIQVNGRAAHWAAFRHRLGANWKYANLAINPFADPECIQEVADQVTVAQFVVTAPDDVSSDGDIRITDGMTISGACAGAEYNIAELVHRLPTFPSWPTCIFLGPALPGWSDEENVLRVSKAVSCFQKEARGLWKQSGDDRYGLLFEMAA